MLSMQSDTDDKLMPIKKNIDVCIVFKPNLSAVFFCFFLNWSRQSQFDILKHFCFFNKTLIVPVFCNLFVRFFHLIIHSFLHSSIHLFLIYSFYYRFYLFIIQLFDHSLFHKELSDPSFFHLFIHPLTLLFNWTITAFPQFTIPSN